MHRASVVLGLMFSVGMFALPSVAPAITIEEMQAQVSVLVKLIAQLQAQLAELVRQRQTQPPVLPVPPDQVRHRICQRLIDRPNWTAVAGAQDDIVNDVQDFLHGQGFFNTNATGYFGALTTEALGQWQIHSGLIFPGDGGGGWGVFGPRTREHIKRWCGSGSNADFSASPQKGEAPLSVVFRAVVRGDDVRPSQYAIDFGDGTNGVMGDDGLISLPCGEGPGSPACGTTPGTQNYWTPERMNSAQPMGLGSVQSHASPPLRPQTNLFASHTYTVNGTYIAILTASRSLCPPVNPYSGVNEPQCMAPVQLETIGKIEIRVGAVNYQNPADDPQCKSWFDGCNTCSRQSPGGHGMCTMMECMRYGDTVPAPYCKEYFDDTPGLNKPPVISSFSGPTTLAVNQTGTWTITASDPENGTLSYSVQWGDENYYGGLPMGVNGASMAVSQNTTFTHSYEKVGTYTVAITVRDAAGRQAKTSTTVRVGSGTVCSGEYAPVCGRPPIPPCTNPPGVCSQVVPLPRTYSNHCQLDAAGATFLYEGLCTNAPTICTQDAMQCPDGSWVGRTGPNCTFVCPN